MPLNLRLIAFFIFTSCSLSYMHFFNAIHIWPQESFIEHRIGAYFESRFLLYTLNGYFLDLFNLSYEIWAGHLALAWDCLSLFLIQLIILNIIKKETGSIAFSLFGILIFLYMIFFNYIISKNYNFYYVYDFSSIAFYSFFIYLSLYYNKLWILLTIVFIGTLNRETAFLMPLTYFILKDGVHDKNVLKKSFLLVLAFILAKIIVIYYMSLIHSGDGNKTLDSVVTFLDTNDNSMRLIRNLEIVFFMLPKISIAFYTAFGFLWIFLFGKDFFKNKFSPLIYLAALYFLLMMFVGNIDELRVYNEVVIMLVFVITFGIHDFDSRSKKMQHETSIVAPPCL
tara:strand:+ start:13765 stop:14781 length:1017 start_codon:yes stop_codon:yes gene_type:complete